MTFKLDLKIEKPRPFSRLTTCSVIKKMSKKFLHIVVKIDFFRKNLTKETIRAKKANFSLRDDLKKQRKDMKYVNHISMRPLSISMTRKLNLTTMASSQMDGEIFCGQIISLLLEIYADKDEDRMLDNG